MVHASPLSANPLSIQLHCAYNSDVSCRVHDVERKYYADGEDAYCMRKTFRAGMDLENGSGKERKAIAE